MSKLFNVKQTRQAEYLKLQKGLTISSIVCTAVALALSGATYVSWALPSAAMTTLDPRMPLIGGGMGLVVTLITSGIFVIFFVRYLTKAKNYTFKSFNIPVLWKRVLIIGIIILMIFAINIVLYVLAMTISDSSDLFCIFCGVPFGVQFLNLIVSLILTANCSKATRYLRTVGRREDIDVEEYDDEEA